MAEGIGNLGWLYAASSLLQMFGAREAGKMARIQGERARVAAEFAAWQAEEQAGNAIAIAQSHAREERRQAELVASRALAVAAASGAGVTDPTVVNIIARTKGEGAYRANVALYEGAARARQLRLDAAAGRVSGFDAEAEGAARGEAYAIGAIGGTAKTASDFYANSLYGKYGRGGPGRGDEALISEPVQLSGPGAP